jgi:hypothetical protein
MAINEDDMRPIINKKYTVTYKNEYDQIGTLEGTLLHPDLSGFTVFEVNKKRVILLKDRIFSLSESETSAPTQASQANQQAGGTKPAGQTSANS